MQTKELEQQEAELAESLTAPHLGRGKGKDQFAQKVRCSVGMTECKGQLCLLLMLAPPKTSVRALLDAGDCSEGQAVTLKALRPAQLLHRVWLQIT